MTHWHMGELDVFFLSYDEPLADEHFAQLQRVSPRPPKRVHGVKGLQSAYETAARNSATGRFLTIDADSFVEDDTAFRVAVDDGGVENLVFAFLARNHVNGLVYGNGSVKCWPKRVFDGLRTHEHAPAGQPRIDFHHVLPYRWLPETASVNCFATDRFQAFRGGYREALKLTVGRGGSSTGPRQALQLAERTRYRISTWISVGMDMEHGGWAIYGARRGLIDYWLDESLRIERLSDFDYFNELWREISSRNLRCEELIAETCSGMARLGLPEGWLTAEESAAVKAEALRDSDAA